MSSMLILLCVSWFALAAAWAPAATPYAPEDAEFHFEQFIQEHGKKYAHENEKKSRFEIFKQRLVKINELNEKSNHAVFGITQFSDMTSEEFHEIHSCLKSSPVSHLGGNGSPCKQLNNEDITYNDAPESFDWRDQNVVSEVKDQLNCGSCYAFSTIGNIESQYAIKHNKQLISLSEQQIVDCDKKNFACGGGVMAIAMRSLIEQGGCMSEADYPYKGTSNTCNFDASKVKVQLTDCHKFNLTSQEKVKQLLYHTGPLSIGIQGEGLMQYKNGIISDEACNVGPISHAVLLVGYGSEAGVPYWIVKNSWNPGFGEKGYFRMHRGENALSCQMLNDFMSSAIVA